MLPEPIRRYHSGMQKPSLAALFALGLLCLPAQAQSPADPVTLKKSCDKGSAVDCFTLAGMQARGEGMPRDASKAEGLYKKACNGNHAPACLEQSRLAKPDEAVKLLDRACTLQSGEACGLLATRYQSGDGVEKNMTRAGEIHQKACDGGWGASCLALGAMLHDGRGVPKDVVKANALYAKACEANEPASCAALGFANRTGDGVAKDPAKAMALFHKACDKRSAVGCYGLALGLENGEGEAKDLAHAFELHGWACDNGEPRGCHSRALMFRDGVGTTKDLAKAVEGFQKACDSGFGPGCHEVAVMYEIGPRHQARFRAGRAALRQGLQRRRRALLRAPGPALQRHAGGRGGQGAGDRLLQAGLRRRRLRELRRARADVRVRRGARDP